MSEYVGHVVTKFQLNTLFSTAWYLEIKPETIINGFRKAGVYPLNEHVLTSPLLSMLSSNESSSSNNVTSDAQIPTC